MASQVQLRYFDIFMLSLELGGSYLKLFEILRYIFFFPLFFFFLLI